MKAKKFVKKARKLMSQKKVAKYLGGDLSEVSGKMLLMNLQVLCVEYTEMKDAQRKAIAKDDLALDERFALKPGKSATVRFVPEKASKTTTVGDQKLELPKGYVLFFSPNTGGTSRNTWDLMRRGHHIGIIRHDPGDSAFGTQHDHLEMGHDCIDTLQDAVDNLISSHEEYIGRKTGRAG